MGSANSIEGGADGDSAHPAIERTATLDTGVLCRESAGGLALIGDGTIALVAGGLGLAAVDISDPAAPRKLATLDTGVLSRSGAGSVAHRGDHVCVSSGTEGGVF